MTGPFASVLGSVALWIAGAFVMWLNQHGVVSADQVSQTTTVVSGILVSGVTVLMSAALIRWKAQQHTQAAIVATLPQSVMISTINNDTTNGLKVVPESSPTPAVTTPQKVS